MKRKRPRRVARSAKTGRFVSMRYAMRYPARCVVEVIK